jgi:hypothetical protein
MCAGAQTAAAARIKAERSRKLARRTSWRLTQQRDGEQGLLIKDEQQQGVRHDKAVVEYGAAPR